MKCKCRLCGAQLDTKTAFRIEGKPNKYYCNESEWLAEEERKNKVAEDKNRMYRLICDILGQQEIVNSALWKELAEWNKVADNAKIAQYLEENKGYLTMAISRLENKIYNRIRYLSAILKNSLGDYNPKVAEERVEVRRLMIDETMYNATPTTARMKRRALDELEDEV